MMRDATHALPTIMYTKEWIVRECKEMEEEREERTACGE
jgi:hypothetical protein